MGTTFSRSVAAQAAAVTVIETAKKDGLLSGPVATAPELAESEKELFLEMFRKLAERQGTAAKSLTSDEISSLFTFVYARAAEAVGNFLAGRPNQFEFLGMFDGKVPFSADERLIGYFKSKSGFPTACAAAYWSWYHDPAVRQELAGIDPVLPLFEALKWTFRISCHYALEKLEADGLRL